MTPSEAPPAPSTAPSPLAWVVAIVAIALMSCLCGLSAGSILVSAGVSAYAGLTGADVTEVSEVTVPVMAETPTIFPTYTFQPTYTLLPTYTFIPTPTLTETPTLAPATATLPVATATTGSGPGVIDEDINHTVVAGDTLESIAAQYGVTDLVPAIYVNELDPQDPQVTVGEEVVLPADVSEYCINPTEAVLAEFKSVVDGDTIQVSIGGQDYTVDYIGVNAPETGPTPEPFAADALNANLDLVTGQPLSLFQDVTNAGDGGVLPRYVFADKTFVNYEMARHGFAVAEPMPPDVSCDDLFDLAASVAADESLGLWGSGQPNQALQTTPGGTAATQPTATLPASGWTPPATLPPTGTSSLTFTCHCNKNMAWGNFKTVAEHDACQAICQLSATRQAAACATAAAAAGVSPGQAGCQ